MCVLNVPPYKDLYLWCTSSRDVTRGHVSLNTTTTNVETRDNKSFENLKFIFVAKRTLKSTIRVLIVGSLPWKVPKRTERCRPFKPRSRAASSRSMVAWLPVSNKANVSNVRPSAHSRTGTTASNTFVDKQGATACMWGTGVGSWISYPSDDSGL